MRVVMRLDVVTAKNCIVTVYRMTLLGASGARTQISHYNGTTTMMQIALHMDIIHIIL